jgi:choline dehydrogenase
VVAQPLGLAGPDTQPVHFSVPLYEPWMERPPNGFTLLGGMVRPQSRGSIRLSGPDPDDPLLIDLNAFELPPTWRALRPR